MQHVEFFHTEHFENNYYRTPPPAALSHFIDFFWETKFEHLWDQYPQGFSDAQFPNIGYTYIINLGTPFMMQVGEEKFDRKNDLFLPRHQSIECYHKPGNKLFGIKFRISPVIFEKKINFSEYSGYVFPLSYLLDKSVVTRVKDAASFEDRRNILSNYFLSLLSTHEGTLKQVHIVLEILDHNYQYNDFTTPVEVLAEKYHISARTLQRYFEATTSFNCKKALQVMRIRKAVWHVANSPEDFDHKMYGYYDRSHFYKHLKQFLSKSNVQHIVPHVELLKRGRTATGCKI